MSIVERRFMMTDENNVARREWDEKSHVSKTIVYAKPSRMLKCEVMKPFENLRLCVYIYRWVYIYIYSHSVK